MNAPNITQSHSIIELLIENSITFFKCNETQQVLSSLNSLVKSMSLKNPASLPSESECEG